MKSITDLKNYVGDVNIEYGGKWYNPADLKHGLVECLEVIDLDSAAGIDNTLLVIDGTIYIPDSKEDRMSALRCIGQDTIPDLDTAQGKAMLIDACHAYYGTEPSSDFISTGYTELYIQFFDDDPIPDGPQYAKHADFYVLSPDVDVLEWLHEHFDLGRFE